MDETYIKVRGNWTYLFRAVDRDGQTLGFMLSERRDTASARRFLKRAVGTNGVPGRIAIDKSGANLAGVQSLNISLKFTGVGWVIGIAQSRYLNNIVEQDHRFIKRITRPMLDFKALHSAAATLAGIETAHMIRKGQLAQTSIPAFKQFAALAASLYPGKAALQPGENFATEPFSCDRPHRAKPLCGVPPTYQSRPDHRFLPCA